MKTLLLAAAAVLALGVGGAFAQSNGNHDPNSVARARHYAAMNTPGSNAFNGGFAAQQQPSAVPEATAPVQPRYQTVLPRAYEDDTGGGG